MKRSHQTPPIGMLELVALTCLGACLSSACGQASEGGREGAPAPADAPAAGGPPPVVGTGAGQAGGNDDQLLGGDDDLVPQAPMTPEDLNPDNACEAVTSEAQQGFRPMDVVLVIDNSGSMAEEIDSVERNINVNFAEILEQSGIDYRVIMLSAYRAAGQQPGFGAGRTHRVCVEPPLGPAACEGRPATTAPHNGELFLHFDQPIGSTDGPCLMFETLTGPPVASGNGGRLREPTIGDDPLLQAGWTAHLRPDAFKAFIMIGDDTVECQEGDVNFNAGSSEDAAKTFDDALRAAAPLQFGAADANRQYSWHSIVGLAPNADPEAVYEAADDLVGQACDSAENPGAPHQALSRLTGGLRYPVCNFASYDAIFRRIATEIVEGAALPCSWEIPPPPDGQTFDKNQVNLAYLPGDGSEAPELGRVDNAAACTDAAAWYYDDPVAPTTVHACPATCDRFTADAGGKVELLFGCATKNPTLK